MKISSLKEFLNGRSVTTDTQAVLSALYIPNTSLDLEKDAVTEMKLLEQTRIEYEGETARGAPQVSSPGCGKGPAQVYYEVFTGLCSVLILGHGHQQLGRDQDFSVGLGGQPGWEGG